MGVCVYNLAANHALPGHKYKSVKNKMTINVYVGLFLVFQNIADLPQKCLLTVEKYKDLSIV